MDTVADHDLVCCTWKVHTQQAAQVLDTSYLQIIVSPFLRCLENNHGKRIQNEV